VEGMSRSGFYCICIKYGLGRCVFLRPAAEREGFQKESRSRSAHLRGMLYQEFSDEDYNAKPIATNPKILALVTPS
jgi:hypothetical protein